MINESKGVFNIECFKLNILTRYSLINQRMCKYITRDTDVYKTNYFGTYVYFSNGIMSNNIENAFYISVKSYIRLTNNN